MQNYEKTSRAWKKYIWNSSTCTCEIGKCLGVIFGNSVIMRDENIEVAKPIPTKTIPTNFKEKKVICTMEYVYILLAFYWLPYIKHWSKQEHLLTYHDTSSILKETHFNNIN